MTDRPADKQVAQEIEFAVCRLDELAVFPSVAERFLTGLNQFQLSPSVLTELIESEPALTARLFLLAHQRAVSGDKDFDIQQVIERFPLRLIRDSLLTLKIYSSDEQRLHLRRQLLRHCICVGCCAESLAKLSHLQQDSRPFYYAGLLHDIGKLALDETMPRSFARIYEQAQKGELAIRDVEKKYLEIDHTILGKRLAERWGFPRELVGAIWLHHSDTAGLIEDLPEARIAAYVQAADIICRQAGIGASGSFDLPSLPTGLLNLLGINNPQIQQLERQLPELVERRCKSSGLDEQVTAERFQNTVQTCAAQLADENRKLADDNYQLQIDSSNLKFLNEFLSNINPDADTVTIARTFAILWQKFYQTGLVCLYLIPPAQSHRAEAVIVQSQSEVKTALLKAPPGGEWIPKSTASGFEVVDAYEGFGWLFEQLDVEFDLSRTIALPLISSDKVLAVLVFELRHPVKKDQLQERFKVVSYLVGKVIALACEKRNQQLYAELFSQLINQPAPAVPKGQAAGVEQQTSQGKVSESLEDRSLDALAEMAAGAAHELNNPLLVVSGRAQLLAENEKDEQKKQILEQIQKNADQISKIVDQLFSYAKPDKPIAKKINVKQLLDEAIQSAAQKAKADTENVSIEIDRKTESIYVDPSQIITALANIICNSFESYITKSGPISITAGPDSSGQFMSLTISDLGCGMDWATVEKATYPFFSAKPAGRKRGMGLAIANRLIQLNKGRLSIESTPCEGTRVTILLPSG